MTPYVIPFVRAFDDPLYNTVVLVTGGQSGKTESVIDVILSRLDQRPVPIIYAGPDRNFVTDQFEPRFDDALNRSTSLAAKLARGKKNKKTRKIVSGDLEAVAARDTISLGLAVPALRRLLHSAVRLPGHLQGRYHAQG